MLADADQLHDLRQNCPHISLEPSPSEAGDIQSAMSMGADSGGADIDKIMLARHVGAIRHRAASIEKAVYFMEKRQDSAASLPSESGRHASQFSDEHREAKEKGWPESSLGETGIQTVEDRPLVHSLQPGRLFWSPLCRMVLQAVSTRMARRPDGQAA